MFDDVLALVSAGHFWALAAAGWLLWWVVGVLLARLLYASSKQPLQAVRRAAWISLALATAGAALFAWFYWGDPLNTVGLPVTVLIPPLVFLGVLLHFEPSMQSQ